VRVFDAEFGNDVSGNDVTEPVSQLLFLFKNCLPRVATNNVDHRAKGHDPASLVDVDGVRNDGGHEEIQGRIGNAANSVDGRVVRKRVGKVTDQHDEPKCRDGDNVL